VIVVDTSFVYALLDAGDRRNAEAASWYAGLDEELVTTPLVVAEVDHLAGRLGTESREAFRADLEAGAYAIDWWPRAEATLVDVARRASLPTLSLTDASLVAAAARFETTRIATFDERHFRLVRPLEGDSAFTLLPADESR
jgi:predicted nucleic acid-binding protein